jgi:hypothetical protein
MSTAITFNLAPQTTTTTTEIAAAQAPESKSRLGEILGSLDPSDVEDCEPRAVTHCFEEPRLGPNVLQFMHSSAELVGKYFVATVPVYDASHEISPGSCGRIIEQSADLEFIVENLRSCQKMARYNVPAAFFDLAKCKLFDSVQAMWSFIDTLPKMQSLADYEEKSLRMDAI